MGREINDLGITGLCPQRCQVSLSSGDLIDRHNARIIAVSFFVRPFPLDGSKTKASHCLWRLNWCNQGFVSPLE